MCLYGKMMGRFLYSDESHLNFLSSFWRKQADMNNGGDDNRQQPLARRGPECLRVSPFPFSFQTSSSSSFLSFIVNRES